MLRAEPCPGRASLVPSVSVEMAEDVSVGGEEGQPEYRCCCSLIGLKKASYLASSIFAALIISNFLVKITGHSDLEWNFELLFLCSDSIAVACLFYGTFFESAAFFQPFIILSIITISFLLLLLVYVGAAVVDPHSYPGEYLELLMHEILSAVAQRFDLKLKDVLSLFAMIFSIVILFALFCHCWFVLIAIRCALYFRAKERTLRPPATPSRTRRPATTSQRRQSIFEHMPTVYDLERDT